MIAPNIFAKNFLKAIIINNLE